MILVYLGGKILLIGDTTISPRKDIIFPRMAFFAHIRPEYFASLFAKFILPATICPHRPPFGDFASDVAGDFFNGGFRGA